MQILFIIKYILEVDLSYPDELHSSHNDHPFSCDRISLLLPSTVGKKEIDLLNKICANTFFINGVCLRIILSLIH